MMSQEEISLDQLVRLYPVPRSEIQRWLDCGQLTWHPDPATGEPRVARDQLDAFLVANNMPPLGVTKAGQTRFQSEFPDTEQIEQELAKLPAEVRAQVSALFEKVRDEPDPQAAMMELLLQLGDKPDLGKTPDS
jgi:hypothetical protein